MNNQTR